VTPIAHHFVRPGLVKLRDLSGLAKTLLERPLYIPEFNRIEDRQTSLAFMKANPFAILITKLEDALVATHLPLLIEQVGNDLIVCGHFAKANHQWRAIEDKDSLAIFHGPHAYISPSLYEVRESVPTWNYAAVHVYGRGRVLKDDVAVRQVLIDLTSRFDPSYYQQWLTFSADYREKMVRRIVAFEIQATRIETKFKLGQNRSKPEQDNLIRVLERSADSNVQGLAALMKQEKLGSP
jgi:transcriptional regulator